MSRPAPVYDTIDGGYSAERREEPRIADRSWAALDDAAPAVQAVAEMRRAARGA